MESLTIRSGEREELVEITQDVVRAIETHGFDRGLAVVYVPHTTAGITINENADPTVREDIVSDLKRLVPEGQRVYRHFEGNSDSHTKASLVGSSVTLLVENRRPVLGRWQGIFLCEFDGPRTRQIRLSFLPGG